MRRLLKNLFAFLLGHATQHSKALAGFVQLLVVVQAVEDFLLGLIADRTSVVEDQTGVLFRLNLPVALLVKRANHLLRVVGVHLATKRLKGEGFLGCHDIAQYRAFAVSVSRSEWR